MPHPSLARNPASIVGAWLTTVSAVAFIVFLAAEAFGIIDNAYAGLFGFVLVPAILLVGLLLIPIGIWREARRRRRGQAAWSWPAIDLNRSHVRRIVLIVALLTVVNLGIVALAGPPSAKYSATLPSGLVTFISGIFSRLGSVVTYSSCTSARACQWFLSVYSTMVVGVSVLASSSAYSWLTFVMSGRDRPREWHRRQVSEATGMPCAGPDGIGRGNARVSISNAWRVPFIFARTMPSAPGPT